MVLGMARRCGGDRAARARVIGGLAADVATLIVLPSVLLTALASAASPSLDPDDPGAPIAQRA
jgi:hypothetical protein